MLERIVMASSDLGETATTTGFGVARDLRQAAVDCVSSGIDWTEATQRSLLRLLRETAQRANQLSDEAFDTGEKIVLATVDLGRDAGLGLAGWMAQTSDTLAGSVEAGPPVSRAASPAVPSA
ncbi:MAG: hypothetical protein MJE66_03650 [Proteobacteria bacterium]|nr:hypothetical protein [Pseudomonadota bacterium]